MSDPPEKLTLGYLLNRESEQARRGQIQRRRRPSTSSSSNTSSPEVIGSSSGGHTRRPVPASSAQPSSSRQPHGRPSSAQSSSGLPVSSGQSSSHPSNLPTPPTQGLASSSGEGAGPSSSQRSFQCELCNRSFVERGMSTENESRRDNRCSCFYSSLAKGDECLTMSVSVIALFLFVPSFFSVSKEISISTSVQSI